MQEYNEALKMMALEEAEIIGKAQQEMIVRLRQGKATPPTPNRATRRAKGERRGFLGAGGVCHSPGNIGETVVW